MGSSVVYFMLYQDSIIWVGRICHHLGIARYTQGLIKDFLNLEFLQACAIMCQYFRKAHSLPAVTTSLVFSASHVWRVAWASLAYSFEGGILCGTCSFLSTEKKHGRYLHGNGRSQFLRSLQWRFISRTSRFAWDWCHFDFSLNSCRQNIDTEHEAICSRLHKKSPVSWFNHVQPSGLRLLSRFLWGPYSKDSMYIACYTSLWFPSVQVCAKHSIDDYRSIQMHKEMHIDHRPLYAVQWTSPLSSNDPSVVLKFGGFAPKSLDVLGAFGAWSKASPANSLHAWFRLVGQSSWGCWGLGLPLGTSRTPRTFNRKIFQQVLIWYQVKSDLKV